jgi:hypothetical protein
MKPLARIAAAAVLCASCQSYELKLVFDIPKVYLPSVAGLQVRYIVPPPGFDGGVQIDCFGIAFGSVNEAELMLRQDNAWQFPVDAPFSLGELPRTGRKIFWVDGIDSNGRRIVSGCGEVDVLTQTSELDIQGFPVVHVTTATDSVDKQTIDFGPMPTPPPAHVTVTATDALGSTGTVPYAYFIERVTDDITPVLVMDGGTLTIEPPMQRGPFSVLIAPFWSDQPTTIVPGMYEPAGVDVPSAIPTNGGLAAMRAGRFLADAGAAVALLTGDNTGTHLDWVFAGSTGLTVQGQMDLAATQLISVREPTGPEFLLATGNQIYVLGDAHPPLAVGVLDAGRPASPIIAFDSACNGSALALIVNQFDPGTMSPHFDAFDLSGKFLTSGSDQAVVAAGCVSNPADGGTLPMLIVDSAAGRLLSALASPLAGQFWGVGNALAFSATPGSPRQIVAVEAAGRTFDIFALQPVIQSGSLNLDQAPTLGPIFAEPLALVTGDFDGNGQVDVAALGAVTTDSVHYFAYILLQGRSHSVAGVMGLGHLDCPPLIDAANLIGGPGDDLIVAPTCPSATFPTVQVFSFEPGP